MSMYVCIIYIHVRILYVYCKYVFFLYCKYDFYWGFRYFVNKAVNITGEFILISEEENPNMQCYSISVLLLLIILGVEFTDIFPEIAAYFLRLLSGLVLGVLLAGFISIELVLLLLPPYCKYHQEEKSQPEPRLYLVTKRIKIAQNIK